MQQNTCSLFFLYLLHCIDIDLLCGRGEKTQTPPANKSKGSITCRTTLLLTKTYRFNQMVKQPEVCSVRNTGVIQQKLFHDVQ